MKDDLYLIAEQYNVVLTEEQEKEEEKNKAIDKLQIALDIAGFEPTFGSIADAINVVISTLRTGLSLARLEGDKAKEHAINAGISAISLLPFADVIKVLKLRKLGKVKRPATKLAVKGGRAIKGYGKRQKQKRIDDYRQSQELDQDNIELA